MDGPTSSAGLPQSSPQHGALRKSAPRRYAKLRSLAVIFVMFPCLNEIFLRFFCKFPPIVI